MPARLPLLPSRFSLVFLFAVFAFWTEQRLYAQEVPSPETHLGRVVGTDFELADWKQVSSYYERLAETSPHVLLEKVGKTSEGRDFLAAVISGEENLSRLDEIKADARVIADPRGKSDEEKEEAVTQGKVIVFITPTMHSTEPAATEMAMQFSWLLATSEEEPWRSARKNAVVVILPSLNPDGVDHVAEWVRQNVGTPYEDASLLKLYQFYTGHDNNRDWFMLTQVETRHLTGLMYNEWFPQFLWDVHQQGSSGERFFVPPYRDPLNPNLDPGIVAGINLVGTHAVMDMTRGGLTGIATGVSYDNWWNGGNRSVPCRHNIIGILTEAASCNLASPVFQQRSSLKDPTGGPRYQPSNQFISPWPGGWWRLSDITRYELAFGQSLLASINREPEFWLRNALEAAERSIAKGSDGGPRAWLVPLDNRDRHAVRRLVDVLTAAGVEIHTSTNGFEADGRRYPGGTLVIWRDQPYGAYVKDLFEPQRFPPGVKPYDVSGWTLPLLLGVRRVEVMHDFAAETKPIAGLDEALLPFGGDPRVSKDSSLLSTADGKSWTELVTFLKDGKAFKLVASGDDAGLLKPVDEEPVVAAKGPDVDGTKKGELVVSAMPRIAVYSPWSASMDEGWLRWVLDDFEIPFVTVRNEMLRAGQIHEIADVLILPDVTSGQLDNGRPYGSLPDAYTGGLDPEGAIAIQAFVRDGGRLICLGDSSNWATELFRLPIVDVTREEKAKGFSCPGSILRGSVESHPLTAGLPAEVSLFFAGSLGWREMTDKERESNRIDRQEIIRLLTYAPTRVLLSGFIEKPEVIEGKSAWLKASYGAGEIHLFGFRPHYRAWSQATFPLLFRAVFFGTGETVALPSPTN